jgi:uncharacterized protein YdiU (UPF0061 family)
MLEEGLQRYVDEFNAESRRHVAGKLGLAECRESDVELMNELHGLLHAAEVDMTLFFRALADVDVDTPSIAPLREASYDAAKMQGSAAQLEDWLQRYAGRVREDAPDREQRRQRMNAVNPLYVMRNYLAQEAIDKAARGDERAIGDLLDVMRHPYVAQPGRERYAAKRPDWARDRAGCSMLSCSS